ncbi:glycosyltransferase family 4 protein [Brasilonema sp. UFV-L1]|uniref:glycosyltransferase family 4 protein n=1 Tax=Brasilonema sp. UFV-L1 TaxID=2234130 RepID=UPI00145CEA35|nr:glycosyltransferase family 4 protein [Brasilonema sp. UFV-L1]NMG07240.1 glycosyltransferase [Brasilonema sp. UFV-L1]
MSKPLRILYAVAPEDVIESYNYWSQGKDAPSQVSVFFSSQFYEVCKALDAKGYVIAQSSKKEFLQSERFTVERRPVPFSKASGIIYHLRQIWCGLWLLSSALRFRANVVVADTGTTHWFVLSLFHWLGIRVILSLHCVLWCKYLPLRLGEKITFQLSRPLFSSQSQAMLAVSRDITQQIIQLTEGKHPPIFEFFPTYRPFYFADIAEPDTKNSDVFRVLFAGRIETDKGVFDLLEIAKRFSFEGRKDIIFDICGEGSELESLRFAAQESGVDASFICHGYCTKSQMKEMFNKAHAVIVPTRTEFIEGFNRVVSESILAGRPAVTSSVCPAAFYVQEAIIEVPPNDVKAYGDAVLKLCDNLELYEQKRLACLRVREQFYDTTKSWGMGLKHILLAIQQEL